MIRIAIVTLALVLPSAAAAQGEEPFDLHPIRAGFELRFASAPNGAVLFEPAFDFALRPAPHVVAGVALGGGSVALLDGERGAFNVQPHVAAATMLGGWLEIYARAGASLQMRDGAGIGGAGAFAPFLGVGARAWLGGCDELTEIEGEEWALCMSVGYELRAQHHLAGSYLMMPAVLPAGSTTVSSAVTLALEL